MENGRNIMENSWQFFKKLNMELPYDPAILQLCIYPREMEIYVYTKACIWMIHNSPKVKKPKFPLMMNKQMLYIHKRSIIGQQKGIKYW